jgi:ABC-type Zn uptake system ZnuABC Zn-binding protein ZnuA
MGRSFDLSFSTPLRAALALLLVVLGATACASETETATETATEAATEAATETVPRFVTTIPPLAMILRPVVDGRGTVLRLLEPGASPHTYDPRPSDLRAVEGSAAVFYGAATLDAWATELPAERRVALLPLLPASARRSMPGGHGAAASEATADPHFWTDPLTVQQVLPPLVDTLCALDATGCSTYRANADTFATRLSRLAGRLRLLLKPVREVPVMLAQPFFRYFLFEYGPRLVDIIEPQPAKEPSPRRIRALTERARADSVRALFTQHQLPPRSAEVVGEAAGVPLYTLDPLGGVEGRTTYETLLLYNARQIVKALHREAGGPET